MTSYNPRNIIIKKVSLLARVMFLRMTKDSRTGSEDLKAGFFHHYQDIYMTGRHTDVNTANPLRKRLFSFDCLHKSFHNCICDLLTMTSIPLVQPLEHRTTFLIFKRPPYYKPRADRLMKSSVLILLSRAPKQKLLI